MEIYGNYCEKTFRKNFSKTFSWIDFNIELSRHLFQASLRKAIAIDPSYISKSGISLRGSASSGQVVPKPSNMVWRFWA